MQSISPLRRLLLVLFIAGMIGSLFWLYINKPAPPDPSPEPYPPLHAEQIRAGIKEYLGKGYRGYEYYAACDSCTTALFDLIDEEHVEVQDGTSWKGRFASGESKTEFFEQFFGEASVSGTYQGFSAEVTGKFNKDVLKKRENSFATANITQTYYRLTLKNTAPLKAQVKQDLTEMPAEELFDTYGTHYLKSIYIGGRITYSSYVSRLKVTENFDMQAAVTASYNESVKGSASGGTADKKDVEEVTRNKSIDVRGGDPALAANVMNGAGEPSENYQKWAQSVPGDMAISDIANGGMIPIYLLVDEEKRQAELSEAWEKYMAAHTSDVLKEGEPEVIQKNDKFILKSKDGRYVGYAPKHWNWKYYYPSIGDEAQLLQFSSGGEELEDNNNIKIETTESFDGSWADYTYLGAFKGKTDVYYWIVYGAKTNWFVERVVPATDKRLRFGDTVRLKNDHFDEYLYPNTDGFITTKEEPYEWIILPDPNTQSE